MTWIARSYRHKHSAGARGGEIDLRCSARLLDPTPEQARCQLLSGHTGAHALMYAHDGERTVRTWTSADADSAVDTDEFNRPWMHGFPVPAWFESPSASGRSG